MRFKRIDVDTVRCIISEEELMENGLEVDDFLQNDGRTESFLRKIISMAEEEVGYKVQGGNITIQVAVLPEHTLALTFSEKPELGISNMLENLKSAVESLELVGISKEYYHLSPMELSGGQKRCVAIAGVLAMQPEILVLDEPAAGLDPETKNEIFELLCRIRKERNNAIVLVSHHMEDVAQFANRVWVMHEGKIAMDGTPEEVYGRVEELEEMHIGIPQITHLTYSLIQEGLPLPRPAINVADAEEMLVRIFKGEKER